MFYKYRKKQIKQQKISTIKSFTPKTDKALY